MRLILTREMKGRVVEERGTRVAEQVRGGHDLRVQRVKICPKCGARFEGAATFCQADGARLELEGLPDQFVGRNLLGQFQVIEPIGAGGMGVVYRAHQEELGRDVAIKVLHPELVQNRDAVRRFQREAKVATALNHPNLVRVFLFGQLDDGSLYLVMEYLDGEPLTKLLAREGKLPIARALHLVAQICDGVGKAHEQGIVHRDVKPENVLIVNRRGDRDFVKVLDFGVARLLWDEQSAMTQSGVIFGTARYISPEGAAGEATDVRSDVYSIGVLLYQLLAGKTPFHSESPVAMLMNHINTPAPDIREHVKLPSRLANLIMLSLAKNPEARPDDAASFAKELRVIARELDVPLAAPWQSVTTSSSYRLSESIAARNPEPKSPEPKSPEPKSPEQKSPEPKAARRSVPDAIDTHTRLDGMREASLTPAWTPTTLPTMSSQTPTPRRRRDESTLSVPGLRSKKRWPSMLLAFALGVSAVCGAAWSAGFRLPGQDNEVSRLTERARVALSEEHFVGTGESQGVAELTAAVLDRDPENAAALTLRREALLSLRERAASARSRNERESARRLYEQVLAFRPNDEGARAAIRELTEPENVVVPTRVTLIPNAPRTRERVTLQAETSAELREAYFQIWRAGRPVRRVSATNAGNRWTATHTFAASGTHTVTFESPGAPTISEEFAVAQATRRRRRLAPTTTQGGAMRPVRTRNANTNSDGIDWSIPENMGPAMMGTTPSNTPPPPPPPAPWTGSGVL